MEITRKLHKINCVIYQSGADEYTILAYGNSFKQWTVSSLGIWILSRLDNEILFDDLVSAITKSYPDVPAALVAQEIENFITLGLLYESGDVKKRQNLSHHKEYLDKNRLDNLNVYINTSVGLEHENNYLLYLFWHFCKTVTVVDTPQLAELVLCSTSDQIERDNDNQLFILASDSDDAADLGAFDYIFRPKAAIPPYHVNWIKLPHKAFSNETEMPGKMLKISENPGYAIDRLAAKFLRFLIGSPEVVVQKEEKAEPFLTIGMATFDDYDGVYFSITSLLIHHREIIGDCEIIILDNNPNGNIAEHLENLANNIPNVRYVPYSDKNSTAVRDIIFKVARGKWVVCMDSHVMLPPGTLTRLQSYMENHPQSLDLLQGPLLSDNDEATASHFKPVWNDGMYGTWGQDDRAKDLNGEPFEIEMQGLGIFACRKAAWPGFNKLFSGFGGEEGYIHQKIRNQGGRALCLPFFQWAHRFLRPNGANYENKWQDRIKNYLIGFEECGLDTHQVEDHFTELLSKSQVDQAKKSAEKLKHSPFSFFDHAVCINMDSAKQRWSDMQTRFETLEIADKVKRFSAIATPEYHHIGCALSHRKIIEHAKFFGYETVLVFEDDALMLPGVELLLISALEELKERPWKLLYLGGAHDHDGIKLAEGCRYLKDISKHPITCTHALVYHQSVYDELLEALPDNEDEMADWITLNAAIDMFLPKIDSRYMVYPKPFTQPFLRAHEDEPYRHFYK